MAVWDLQTECSVTHTTTGTNSTSPSPVCANHRPNSSLVQDLNEAGHSVSEYHWKVECCMVVSTSIRFRVHFRVSIRVHLGFNQIGGFGPDSFCGLP